VIGSNIKIIIAIARKTSVIT